MSDAPLNEQELSLLREIDTPTICNALEIVSPERRAIGFTVSHLHCAFLELPPMVGYARTARVRAAAPPGAGNQDQTAARLAYYRYIEDAPGPTVMVIEDIDTPPGYGSWWGEVHSNVHRSLGSLGVVTSGSVRDLDMIAEGFQLLSGSVSPSHAWVQLVDCGTEVNVHGMVTNSGDLIHADRHGAVIIPHEVARQVPAAAELCMRREKPILDACKSGDFSVGLIEKALKEAGEIH
ncbi:MAG: RraA family protein [Rhodospirillaceae bacterium]|nr:RraA family protein [Rhodospirillaceae bacterium]